MIPLILPLLFNYLIIGNSTWNSTSSTSGLLQNLNSGLGVDSNGTFANPLGSAIVVVVFIVVVGITSFKIDLPLAAALGSLIATATALLLQTPGLAIVGSVLPYVFGSMTLFFIFIALLAGTKSPFK